MTRTSFSEFFHQAEFIKQKARQQELTLNTFSAAARKSVM